MHCPPGRRNARRITSICAFGRKKEKNRAEPGRSAPSHKFRVQRNSLPLVCAANHHKGKGNRKQQEREFPRRANEMSLPSRIRSPLRIRVSRLCLVRLRPLLPALTAPSGISAAAPFCAVSPLLPDPSAVQLWVCRDAIRTCDGLWEAAAAAGAVVAARNSLRCCEAGVAKGESPSRQGLC